MKSHRSTGVFPARVKNPLQFPTSRGNAQSHTFKRYATFRWQSYK